jgi:hypothetical protein
MPTVADYDNFVTQYERFTQDWRTRNETYRATAQYVVPWMTLMPGHTARLRVKMQVNVPSGNLSVCIQGSAIGNLSINMRTMPADRTGDYYLDTDLEITCTGGFSTQSSLEVYATGHELVGKLNFLPNANIRPVDVAIVTVKTKNGTAIHRRAPSQEILDSMTRLLGQAYIDPQFKHYTLDLSGPVITKTVEERANPARSTMVKKTYVDIGKYDGREPDGKKIQELVAVEGDTRSILDVIWRIATNIHTAEPLGTKRFDDFHSFLDKQLLKRYPELEGKLKLYFINERIETTDGSINGQAFMEKGSILISTLGYNNATPTHELLHCLSLKEAWENEGTHTVNKVSTDNIMDYDDDKNSTDERISLWRWQMRQVWNHLNGLGL